MNKRLLEKNSRIWLEEDMPYGDITTDAIVGSDVMGHAKLIAKAEGMICGLFVLQAVFSILDSRICVQTIVKDGDRVTSGTLLAVIEGPMHAILKGERTALNIIQRLSGIATQASAYADEVRDLAVKIVDTRKTTPGLRYFEKMAVHLGGCTNHRLSLSDAVMIKDNHIIVAGSISKAVASVRMQMPYTAKIEVEVDNMPALTEAIDAKVDIIMLDNMTLEEMRDAVGYVRDAVGHTIILEASGNMTLDRIREVALTGVDIISVGALTHSVKALDMSLKLTQSPPL